MRRSATVQTARHSRMVMALASLRREERAGLAAAVGLHLALLAMLLFQPAPPPPPMPERMTVSLAEDVGLRSEAPELVSESQASAAPTLEEEQAPQIAAPQPPKAVIEDRPKPDQPRAKPAPRPAAKPPAKSAGGARSFDQAFAGAGSSTNTAETRIPASEIGASAKASLVQAISRQIKPKWEPPNGPDVEKITTYLRFRLDEDGSLAGRPEVVRQTGINETNRAQAARHAEQAVRAVQLAAPFDLPVEYYNAWKLVGPFGFDWKLSQ